MLSLSSNRGRQRPVPVSEASGVLQIRLAAADVRMALTLLVERWIGVERYDIVASAAANRAVVTCEFSVCSGSARWLRRHLAASMNIVQQQARGDLF
jgi:hypothetical protein